MRAFEICVRGKTLADAKVAFMEECRKHGCTFSGFVQPDASSPHILSVLMDCNKCFRLLAPYYQPEAPRSINVSHYIDKSQAKGFWLFKLIYVCPTCL